MVTILSNGVSGRLAGWLFLSAGLIVGFSLLLPVPDTVDKAGTLGLCAVAMGVGVTAIHAPWDDWPRSRTLLLAFAAFGLMTVGGLLAFEVVQHSNAIFWMLAFTWVGLGHPRWTSARIAPFAAVGFIIPIVNFTENWAVSLRTTAIVIPSAVLIGEVLAWISHHLEVAEQRDAGHIESQRALLTASTALAHQADFDTASYIAARNSGELLGSAVSMVFITESSGLKMIGSWPEPADGSRIDGAGVEDLLSAIREDRCLNTPKGQESPIRDLMKVATMFLIPIRGAGDPIGAIALGFMDETHQLDEFEMDIAHTFATQVGLAFERFWATQSLLDDSIRDELTGVGNRRHVSALLGNLQTGDAIVMLDLDNFKEVNDALGHSMGDEVLREVGAYLRSALRDSDSVARYGGEEFLLLLRRAGPGGVTKTKELLEGWRRTNSVVTFSAGVAIHDISATPLGTVKNADAALYLAKSRGRDQVCSEMDLVAVAS